MSGATPARSAAREAFLEAARQALGLGAPALALLRAYGPRSYEEVHALLEAMPSLEAAYPGLVRQELLAVLRPRLSVAYQDFLRRRPPPQAMQPGAALTLVFPPPSGNDEPAPPPDDLPGRDLPRTLEGAPGIDLRAGLGAWPLRDQGGRPTCVPFAACATLELLAALPGGTPERLAPMFLYPQMRALQAAQPGPAAMGAAQGGTKLGQAREVLLATGVCAHADWPDSSPLKRLPDRTQLPPIRQQPARIDHWDRGLLPPENRWPGAARAVYQLLAEGRPVAISFPEFADPNVPRVRRKPVTNWWSGWALYAGEVASPQLPPLQHAPIGHAVCVLGFQPDAGEALGGWFTLRNSMGQRWATGAPNPAHAEAPNVPEPGYGAMAAGYVEQWVHEIFAPAG